MVGGILSGIGNIVGSIGGIVGQQQANKQNEKLMREQWAREDNAISRRAIDLKNAGINPLMAGGVGGAGAGQLVSMQNEMAGLGNIGTDIGSLLVASKDAETNRMNAETNQENTEISRSEAISRIAKNEQEIQKSVSDIKTAEVQQALMQSGIQLNAEQANGIKMQIQKSTQEIGKMAVEMENLKSQTMKNKTENEISKKYLEMLTLIDNLAGGEGVGQILVNVLGISKGWGIIKSLGNIGIKGAKAGYKAIKNYFKK